MIRTAWALAATALLLPSAALLVMTAVASFVLRPPHEKHQYIDAAGNRLGEVFLVTRSFPSVKIVSPEKQLARAARDASFALALFLAGCAAHLLCRWVAKSFGACATPGFGTAAAPWAAAAALIAVALGNVFAGWEFLHFLDLLLHGSGALISVVLCIGFAGSVVLYSVGLLFMKPQPEGHTQVAGAMLIDPADHPKLGPLLPETAPVAVRCAVTLAPEIRVMVGQVNIEEQSIEGMLIVLPLTTARLMNPEEFKAALDYALNPMRELLTDSKYQLSNWRGRINRWLQRSASAELHFAPVSELGSLFSEGPVSHLRNIVNEATLRRQALLDATPRSTAVDATQLTASAKLFAAQCGWPIFLRLAAFTFHFEGAHQHGLNLSLKFVTALRSGALHPRELDPEGFSHFLDHQIGLGWDGLADFERLDLNPIRATIDLFEDPEKLEEELSLRERRKVFLN